MAAGRVCMRYVREILRLGHEGISKHQIAWRTGVEAFTVRETMKRFAGSGLVWPLGDDITDMTCSPTCIHSHVVSYPFMLDG
jgi:hypothetical protein